MFLHRTGSAIRPLVWIDNKLLQKNVTVFSPPKFVFLSMLSISLNK